MTRAHVQTITFQLLFGTSMKGRPAIVALYPYPATFRSTGGGTNSCGTIPVGGSCTCTGSYTPPSDQCGPFTDTATASGTDAGTGLPTGAASKSAQGTLPRKRSLSVTKACENASGPCQPS